jgi:pimeloyl-ACP methyl ester carboxylesterase
MLQSAAELQRGYRALQVPTFISAGADDRIVNPSQADRLHQDVRGSELQIMPGVGYMMQHSAPDRVAAVVHRSIGAIQVHPRLPNQQS